MKKFELEKALAGEQVCNGLGESVRIVSTDCKVSLGFPLLGLVSEPDGTERIELYAEDGRFTIVSSDADRRSLFMAPSKYTGWVNIYSSDDPKKVALIGGVFESKEEADAADVLNRRSTCTQIEWED